MIARGTTPSLQFTFETVDIKNISTAYMTIEQFHRTVIEKDLTAAEKSTANNALTWDLTQEETLKLSDRDDIKIQIRYKTIDDNAFISQIYTVKPYEILKEGVI